MIAAVSKNWGIGKNGILPWHYKKDLEFFFHITKYTDLENTTNAIVMGRSTWDSLPVQPLPKRHNIILTRNKDYKIHSHENTTVCNSIQDMIWFCNENEFNNIWIIGGEQIYKDIYENYNGYISDIYLTFINKDYEVDTYFPVEQSELMVKFKYELLKYETEQETGLLFQHYWRN